MTSKDYQDFADIIKVAKDDSAKIDIATAVRQVAVLQLDSTFDARDFASLSGITFDDDIFFID